jgi:hypothetical protein
MSLKLDLGIVLKWDDPFFITAFPIDQHSKETEEQ